MDSAAGEIRRSRKKLSGFLLQKSKGKESVLFRGSSLSGSTFVL